MGLFLKSIWNKSAYLRRNSAKTLRFSLGHVRQVQSLAKSAVFFSYSYLNVLSLRLFSNSFLSSPFVMVAKPCAYPRSCTASTRPFINAPFLPLARIQCLFNHSHQFYRQTNFVSRSHLVLIHNLYLLCICHENRVFKSVKCN